MGSRKLDDDDVDIVVVADSDDDVDVTMMAWIALVSWLHGGAHRKSRDASDALVKGIGQQHRRIVKYCRALVTLSDVHCHADVVSTKSLLHNIINAREDHLVKDKVPIRLALKVIDKSHKV